MLIPSHLQESIIRRISTKQHIQRSGREIYSQRSNNQGRKKITKPRLEQSLAGKRGESAPERTALTCPTIGRISHRQRQALNTKKAERKRQKKNKTKQGNVSLTVRSKALVNATANAYTLAATSRAVRHSMPISAQLVRQAQISCKFRTSTTHCRIPTPTDANEAARLRQIKPKLSPNRNQPSRTEVDEPPLEASNQCIMKHRPTEYRYHHLPGRRRRCGSEEKQVGAIIEGEGRMAKNG